MQDRDTLYMPSGIIERDGAAMHVFSLISHVSFFLLMQKFQFEVHQCNACDN